MKKTASFLVVVAVMALASSLASAYDPSPLQDFCVAIDEPKNAGISIYIMISDLKSIFSITLSLILMIYLFLFPVSKMQCL